MHQLDHSEYTSENSDKSIVLVLDEVSNPQNIGLILRSAYFFGVSDVYIIGESDRHKQKKIEKISRSALNHVKVHFNKKIDCLQVLKSNAYAIVSLEICDKSININEFNFGLKTALVIGNEKSGVSQIALDLSDHAVHISGYTSLSSLNVAQATAIALFKIQE